MKNILIAIVLVVLIAIILLSFVMTTGNTDTDVSSGKSGLFKSSSVDLIYTNSELSERINEEIANGKDGTLTFNVSTFVTDDDIRKVNYSIDTSKGSIKSITTYTEGVSKGTEFRKVEFDFERSDALYVYEAIAKGKDIPADRVKAKELLKACNDFINANIRNGMSDYDKELTIHDYIVNNCRYGLSLAKDDTEYTAYGVLVNKRAVCSGYAAAMQLLLSCTGVESRIVTGEADSMTDKAGKENHAWNQVKIDGIWYNLDSTWDDPVSNTEDTITHEFFNVNDSILSKTHKWENSDSEKCDSLKENYYMHNGAFFSDLTSLENYMRTEITAANKDTVECAVNNIEINDDSLQFIFNINGVSNASYSTSGLNEYNIVTVYINR